MPKVEETEPEVYALYLQARHLGRRGTPGDWEKSNALYQQALAIDPNYATAWSGLADKYTKQAVWSLRLIDEGFTLARETANQAPALNPVYAPAHASLGNRRRVRGANLPRRLRGVPPAGTPCLSGADSLNSRNLGATASLERMV